MDNWKNSKCNDNSKFSLNSLKFDLTHVPVLSPVTIIFFSELTAPVYWNVYHDTLWIFKNKGLLPLPPYKRFIVVHLFTWHWIWRFGFFKNCIIFNPFNLFCSSSALSYLGIYMYWVPGHLMTNFLTHSAVHILKLF